MLGRLNLAFKIDNRSDKRSSRAEQSGKSKFALATSPLTRFLQDIDDPGESRLATLAVAAIKKPFDEAKFRQELVEKLKHVRYPQPRERETGKKTFYVHLVRANAIETVLGNSTLQEIWNCRLIPRIIGLDRRLQKQLLSVVGRPLTSHRRLAREAEKRLQEIKELESQIGNASWMNGYRDHLNRQFRHNITLVILSKRAKQYPGARVKLLSGQSKTELRHSPWNARLAAEVAVYWILRTRLPRTVSDRFLRQLSLLINSSDATGSDENLRNAIKNDNFGWRKLLKIPQKK